ncbi:TPA: hypothetical protein KRD64_001610 [Clostridioides difficile]|uniref:hypothetical protein n=1 Tax=Clostridioides difficile TaxID=1496 RepID=UPI0011B36561|nr:hypothetical protein [Clostridioides difficile]MDI6156441.1 hypothetical protein [Clostridioides difficile]HBG7379066.1 hypothetical protein [Clostridioides difficile]
MTILNLEPNEKKRVFNKYISEQINKVVCKYLFKKNMSNRKRHYIYHENKVKGINQQVYYIV